MVELCWDILTGVKGSEQGPVEQSRFSEREFVIPEIKKSLQNVQLYCPVKRCQWLFNVAKFPRFWYVRRLLIYWCGNFCHMDKKAQLLLC